MDISIEDLANKMQDFVNAEGKKVVGFATALEAALESEFGITSLVCQQVTVKKSPFYNACEHATMPFYLIEDRNLNDEDMIIRYIIMENGTKKLIAVKALRNRYNCGLREAKFVADYYYEHFFPELIKTH
jgi:ribosomal protein L7/L12